MPAAPFSKQTTQVVPKDETGGAAHLASTAAHDLMALQHPDGHMVFELEADATMPAEHIFLNHFLGDPEPEYESAFGDYIRSQQSPRHGGWAMFEDGDFNMSASVKAYFALRLLGDSPDARHMIHAREAILAAGGAETANVFTRYTLALYGVVPWHAVPAMPAEIMILPRWFPINIWRFSYWSRTFIAPLTILAALRPRARNPTGATCRELFVTPPEDVKVWNHNHTGSRWGTFFLALDRLIVQPLNRYILPWLPFRKYALKCALDFIVPRLNGIDGLGGILPPMANATMAFDSLGYPRDHPHFVIARDSVRALMTPKATSQDIASGRASTKPRYAQACVSPVWDTALSAHALLEAGVPTDDSRVIAACEWLADRQITDVVGDWAVTAPPGLQPGGWAFQYRNDYYPDVDDTAVVGMLLHRVDKERYAWRIERAALWVEGMQSTNGGWGAFDVDNNSDFLNSIPFADHGALLDPPTSDVTARCLSFLAQIGRPFDHPVVQKGVKFLRDEQEADGSWFGRWGINYVYGTWSVLCAFNAFDIDNKDPAVRRGVEWLKRRQRRDGGWGEDPVTYWKERRYEVATSTASQTAWALMGLMAAGEVESEAVENGVRYLTNAPRTGVKWDEPAYTGNGFPKVFYLRYHGYSTYFPTWALGRYATLKLKQSRKVEWGM